MAKTSRLVILLEPPVAAQLKRWSRHHRQPVSAVVRRSISYYLNFQAAQERMAKVHQLKALQVPLKDLKTPSLLEQALEDSYRRG